MENYNPFSEQYNKHEVNWRKSVSEISKFIVDHLEKSDFYDFLDGEEIDKEKLERWQTRLDDLIDKVTKRMGYKIDENKLFMEAYDQILNQKTSGELPPSKSLEYFCNNIDNLKEKRAVLQED